MKTLSTILIALFVFSFLIIALPEKGYSSCCISVGGCVDIPDGIVVKCFPDTFVEGGVCEPGPGEFGQCVVPRNVPTLSEWGLIATAGILGFIGFMVIRRKKATA